MEELTKIEFIKELYNYFNIRGLLDESQKKRIDTSLDRDPIKIGDKVDDFIKTIFESDIVSIIEDRKYLEKMEEKLSFFIKNYENIPSAFRIKSFIPAYMSVISFIGAATYIVNTKSFDVNVEEFIPYKSFDGKKYNSTIKSIFKWIDDKDDKNILKEGGVDHKTYSQWCDYRNPEIINNQSIIKLKKKLDKNHQYIKEKDRNLFISLLFFGRVFWKCYIEIKESFPIIEYIGYLVFINLNSKENELDSEEKGLLEAVKKLPLSQYELSKFLRENLAYKGELLVDYFDSDCGINKVVRDIFNSSTKYQNLKKLWDTIKVSEYKELKEWYKAQDLRSPKQPLEKGIYRIIFSYIYMRSREFKDRRFIRKLENDLKYRYELFIVTASEFRQEVLVLDNLIIELLKEIVKKPLEVILSEEEIVVWALENLSIKDSSNIERKVIKT